MVGPTLNKQTLSQQVADMVRSRILSGDYAGGTQLRQEHIAGELGVSRIPVREALHQLHSEGFVTLVSHKGAVVSELSLDQIVELYELRARVETWLLSLAIPHMTEKDLERAQIAAEKFGNTEAGIYSHQLNWEFHEALYAPSGRKVTIEIIFGLHEKIERYTKLMMAIDSVRQKESHADHLKLIELCRAKDTLRAVNLLDMHISEGGKQLALKLEEMKRAQALG
ncbi:GntR family transcriptional regulator (plasmid) [Rhizobium sp. 32-5/1]|uniref:GntR family transcriptional regulator n=1 Tax=Rhizobium sp. 32-5/1 TaxID=3019602 RepID=UPI00240D6298|nr:GntR family transcriptional regulator [Rhizobium sp. 32-5/1]WEZ85474.1 GntR family transcriptional regulator [Rhizobium sp. 32-5/1]